MHRTGLTPTTANTTVLLIPKNRTDSDNFNSGRARLLNPQVRSRQLRASDRAVNRGQQQSLANTLTRPPTWDRAGRAGGLDDLLVRESALAGSATSTGVVYEMTTS
jgi:hypothetical protein